MKQHNRNMDKTKSKKTVVVVSIIATIILIVAGITLSTIATKGEEALAEAVNTQGIKIQKSEITETATFYPYQAQDTYMDVIAIRATDGTVRTALNTFQVCTGSGRAYYEQEGDALICQNCGNRFTVDQIEVIKGGCNPVPILASDKEDNGDTITISDEFLVANKNLFVNWKN